nr:hypothetical protein [Streptomyces varsoviensis]
MTGGEPGPGYEPVDEPGPEQMPGDEPGPGGDSEGGSPVGGGERTDGGASGDAEPSADGGQPVDSEQSVDSGPRPLGVHRAPTGNADVDTQLDRLADADHLAASGHLEVYEDVHRGLRSALTALDQRPGPDAPSGPYDNRS